MRRDRCAETSASAVAAEFVDVALGVGISYHENSPGDGNTYALNASTGALLWRYTTEEFSSPAVANGVVYIGSGDNNVYALNASTGALLWKYTTGAPVESSPAVANGVVYVGSDDFPVYAFSLP
jgi:outer membrane protein assembly factor BamB